MGTALGGNGGKGEGVVVFEEEEREASVVGVSTGTGDGEEGAAATDGGDAAGGISATSGEGAAVVGVCGGRATVMDMVAGFRREDVVVCGMVVEGGSMSVVLGAAKGNVFSSKVT